MTSNQGRQESSFIYKIIAHLMPHGYHICLDRFTKDAAACLRGQTNREQTRGGDPSAGASRAFSRGFVHLKKREFRGVDCRPLRYKQLNRPIQKANSTGKGLRTSSSCSSSETQPLQLINAQFPGTRVPSLVSPVPYQGLRTWDTNGDPKTGESPEIRLGP
ncbi:hypothetical protein HZ326_5180 [Fusarium oxysporum f. sp. albedinis]|nr:hypothetical protein HZ326_5180 [Fusarium oxysporum f. sp. albedinis]